MADRVGGRGGRCFPAWSTHPCERSQRRMTPRRQGPGGSDFAADVASKSGRGLLGPQQPSPISHTQSLPAPHLPAGLLAASGPPTLTRPTVKVASPSVGPCRLGVPQDWRAAIWKRSPLTQCCQIPCPLCQGATDRQTGSLFHVSPARGGDVTFALAVVSQVQKETAMVSPLAVNLRMDALPPALLLRM